MLSREHLSCRCFLLALCCWQEMDADAFVKMREDELQEAFTAALGALGGKAVRACCLVQLSFWFRRLRLLASTSVVSCCHARVAFLCIVLRVLLSELDCFATLIPHCGLFAGLSFTAQLLSVRSSCKL